MNRALRVRMRHGIALGTGLAVFVVIFLNVDLWVAVQSGIATALAIYLLAHLSDPGTSDGGA